jgi:hypothetical protein
MLHFLHSRVPGPMQGLVDNVLHERAQTAWTSDAWALFSANAQWVPLLEKLHAGDTGRVRTGTVSSRAVLVEMPDAHIW